MKKVLGIVFFLLSIAIILLFIYSKNKNVHLEFYSPKEAHAYVLKEDGEMSFDIYSKRDDSIVCNKDLNIYTLHLDQMSICLEVNRINVLKMDDYSIIRIYSKLPLISQIEYYSSTLMLEIKNSKYTLNLNYGSISILKEGIYPLLSLDELHGTYSYMNGTLVLSGINVTLTNSYSYLSKVRIGMDVYGTLSDSLFDTELDNICDLTKVIKSYNPKRIEESYLVGLKSKKIFIPLGYKDISLIRDGYMIFTLDNQDYYFDTFSFMTNLYAFDEYKDMMMKGEVIYA